jgi:predicted transcriptional regulator
MIRESGGFYQQMTRGITLEKLLLYRIIPKFEIQNSLPFVYVTVPKILLFGHHLESVEKQKKTLFDIISSTHISDCDE